MASSLWRKAASVILAAGATTGGISCLAPKEAAVVGPGPGADAKATRAGDTPVAPVKSGNLRAAVEEWGLLEATLRQDAVCLVEGGGTTIIRLLPEGAEVAKGQVVCELDSSAFRDGLAEQGIAVQRSEASHRQALLEREIAEYGLREYEEGIRAQQLNSLGEQVNATRKGIQKAEGRLNRLRLARKTLDDLLAARGAERTAIEIVADLDLTDRIDDVEGALARERSAFGRAESALAIFERYGSPKRAQELKSAVEKARADELAKRASWEQEKAKEAKYRRQIEACRVVAPADGVVVYAKNSGRMGEKIEEGASVRERQVIFNIPDLGGPMRVEVKVPERLIEWVKPGMPAGIKVEAFAGEALSGVVESIAPFPDIPNVFDRVNLDVFDRVNMFYTTFVAIEERPPGLAPGMTAQVEILTNGLDNVLSVPATAPVYYDYKDHVAIRKSEGGFDWREVTLGLSDGTNVEVKRGLKGGEVVAIEPDSLLSGGQKLRISRSIPKPPPRPASLARPAMTKGKAAPKPAPRR